jgi:hypothetical protein
VYCLGFFHQKCGGYFVPFTPTKIVKKTLNPIILPSKFESTLHTLDLNVAQFPNVTKCHNLSLGLATKARACEGAGQ